MDWPCRSTIRQNKESDMKTQTNIAAGGAPLVDLLG